MRRRRMRTVQTRVVLLLAAFLPLASPAAPKPFKVGIVSSQTGGLKDMWNEGVAGYEVWKKKVDQRFPNGFPITDVNGKTFSYKFELDVRDDESDLSKHMDAVEGLMAEGAHFIMNAQPVFAVEESIAVNAGKRLNMHGATSNDNVFARDLPNVFGLAQSHHRFFPDTFKQFKAQGVRRVAIVYREDVTELVSAGAAAIKAAGDELLPVQNNIGYAVNANASSAEAVKGVAKQLNTSSAEALVACVLTEDAHHFIDAIHEMKKPLKSMVFTNGPASEDFLQEVGKISEFVLTPASWDSTLKYSDSFFGDAKDYSVFYQSAEKRPPTHVAAGASASGYLLMLALQRAFKECDIQATAGDPFNLLFGSSGNITCVDNLNDGHERVRETLSLMKEETFFGSILFDTFRQNFASEVKVLQVIEKIRDLRVVLTPAVVLPLRLATASLELPQPNRYNPVCPQGSYQNPDEFEPCIKCEKGHFQEKAGALRCTMCFKNFYANVTGASQCDRCPANSETAVRGATAITQCTCKPGFFTKLGRPGTPCEPCPAHATCAGDVDPPRNDPGWHAEKDQPWQMYSCNPGTPCTGNFTCAEGYTGRMCADCEEGYFVAFESCWPCITPAGNLIVMLLVYMVFIVMVIISRQLDIIHLLMNFCQTLSILALFNVGWPDTLGVIFNIAALLSFEMDLVQPQCVAPKWGFAENLYIQLAWPVFLLIMTFTWTSITQAAFRLKLKVQGKSLDDFSSSSFQTSFSSQRSGSFSTSKLGGASMGSSSSMLGLNTSKWYTILQAMFYIPSSPQEMNELWLERMGIPLMAMNLGYVVLLKYVLIAFSCRDFMGTFYLSYEPSMECYTADHYKLMLISAAGMVVYVGGTWFMFGHAMYNLKITGSLGEKRPLLLFGWMYERFEAKYFWFEMTMLAEKTAFVLCATFLVEDPVMQVLICMVVEFVIVLVAIKTSAPIDSYTAALLTAADGVVLIMMVLGLVFYNDMVLERTQTFALVLALISLFGLLGVLGAAFIYEAVFHIIIYTLQNRHKQIAARWGQDARKHRHMYRVFKPMFLFRWLTRADVEGWQAWHRLCSMLHSTVHPTCETSYLSQRKVGHFWSYLLNSFPEMLDFLASVEEFERDDFVNVIEVMYEHYFEADQTFKCQLNNVVTDRFRAPLAQWLSSATEAEAAFLRQMMTGAYAKAQGKEAEEEIARAFSRSSKSGVSQSRKGYQPDKEIALVSGSSGLLSKDSSLINNGSEDFILKGGRNFGEYVRSVQNKVTPTSSKAQLPEIPIPSALKKSSGQMSTAHVLQPPGTESSPFAAAQGSSPSIRYKNFKFDLEESTANGEAEKQQELQGQRSETLPMQPSNLAAGNNLSSVNGVHGMEVDADELLQSQNSSPRTSYPGINSPRNPRPPSLTRFHSEASLRSDQRAENQQALGVGPATSDSTQHGNGDPLLLLTPIREEGEHPAAPAKQPAQSSLSVPKKDSGSFEDSARRLANVVAPDASVPSALPDDGCLFVPRFRPGSQGQGAPSKESPQGRQGGAAVPAAPGSGPSNPVDGSLAQAAELPKDDDEVHPFVVPEPSSIIVAAEGTEAVPPDSSQPAEQQQEPGEGGQTLRSMSSVDSEPDGPGEVPGFP